jgi:hypothetical protein
MYSRNHIAASDIVVCDSFTSIDKVVEMSRTAIEEKPFFFLNKK